jgi:hypothetical protein
MAGGTIVFHRTINSKASLGRHEQKQQQHQKQNPSEEEMESRDANAIRVPKKELDTADFLIDGLTCGCASGASLS